MQILLTTKFKTFILLIIFSLVFISVNPTNAAIRDTITYQGKVVDSSLIPPSNGTYNMQFRVYDSLAAGNLLWTESYTGGNQVTINNGVFTVELNSVCASWTGACASNGGIDWTTDSYYLEVGFDADSNGSYEEIFAPRKRFTSVPYAQVAAQLNTAVDIDFNNNVNHNIQWNETTDKTLTIENDDATAVANLSVEGQTQVGNFAVAPTALGNGSMYYNTTSNLFYVYQNGAWVSVGSGGGGGDAIWDADTDTGIQTEEAADDDTIRFDVGDASGTAYPDILKIDGTNGLVWNDVGADLDFRVEGDTEENLLFVDGSTDQIGIGTNNPGYNLDLVENLAVTDPMFRIYQQNAAGDAAMQFAAGNQEFTMGMDSDNGDKFKIAYDTVLGNNNEWFTIERTGDIGIGTTNPGFKLEVEEAIDASTAPLLFLDAQGVTADSAMRFRNAGGNSILMGIDADDGNRFKISDSTSLGNTDRLIIETGGNIGVNTADPTARFEITGSNANTLRINPFNTGLGQTGQMQFMELAANGTNYVSFRAPDLIASNVVLTLPTTNGNPDEFLMTDGSGILSWGNSMKSLWDADTDTGIQVEEGADDDTIRFDLGDASGTAYPDLLKIDGTNGLVWNDAGNALDFRIEGDTDANLLFLDASGDNVGIGEAVPDANAKLEIAGNFMLDDYVYFNNTTTDYLRHDGTTFVMSDDFLASIDDTYDFGSSIVRWNDQYLGGTLSLGANADDYDIHFDETNNMLVLNDVGDADGLRVEGDTLDDLFFVDAVNDRVGLGVTTGDTLFDSRLTVANATADSVLRLTGPDDATYHYGAKLRFGDGDYAYIDEYADDNLQVYSEGNLYLTANNGEVYMPSAYSNNIGNVRDLYVAADGEIGYRASSIRYKENVLDMENIDWLYDLRPVNYVYKDKIKEVYNKETGLMEEVIIPSDKSKQYGLIAEEVDSVNKSLVSYNEDGSVETVNYSYLMTPLLKAVQDNKAAVDPVLDRIKIADNGLEVERYNAANDTDALLIRNDGEGAGLHLVQTGDSNGLGSGAAIYISGNKNSVAGDNNGVADSSDSYGIYINSEESNGKQKIIGMETDAGSGNDEEAFYVRADGVTKVYGGNDAPDRHEDGEFGFGMAGNRGRLYFQAGGKDFYINRSGTGDFSEYVESSDLSLFEDWGTIISLDVGGTEAKAKRSSEMKDKNVLGVVSELGTRNNDNEEGTRHEDPNYVNVALMGQVPAKVTNQNGAIEAGDYLTTSLVYGHAMKADIGDPVIGIALESFYGSVDSSEGMIDVLLSRNSNGNISALLQELQEKKSLSKDEVLDVIMNENLVSNYLVMTKGEVMDGLKVHGELQLDNQNIGQTVLAAGKTEVIVNFPISFIKTPVVTVSPYLDGDNILYFDFQYILTDISVTGFKIILNQALDYNLYFNWQAFVQADYTNDFSINTENPIIEPAVVEPVIQSVDCRADNLPACVTAHDCWQFSEIATWTGEVCALKEVSF